jgi:hypothetical protein
MEEMEIIFLGKLKQMVHFLGSTIVWCSLVLVNNLFSMVMENGTFSHFNICFLFWLAGIVFFF